MRKWAKFRKNMKKYNKGHKTILKLTQKRRKTLRDQKSQKIFKKGLNFEKIYKNVAKDAKLF